MQNSVTTHTSANCLQVVLFFPLSSIWTVSVPAVVWSDTQPDNRVGPKWNQKQFVLVWAIIPFPISHASPFSPLSPSLYLLPRIKRNDFRHSYKKQLLSNFPLRNILKAIPDLHILFQITNCACLLESPEAGTRPTALLDWAAFRNSPLEWIREEVERPQSP